MEIETPFWVQALVVMLFGGIGGGALGVILSAIGKPSDPIFYMKCGGFLGAVIAFILLLYL